MYPNNMYKTPEQQIDEAVEISKALFMPQAKSQQEADSINTHPITVGTLNSNISPIR